jgi:hypothetical protein
VAIALFTALLGLTVTACDWLFGLDEIPPTCRITSPADSAKVSGSVPIQAEATDSVAMDKVEFYVDGGLAGWSVAPPYSVSWDVTNLPEHSWHRLHCVARDAAGNRGYSDTISVEIGTAGARSIFHGEVSIAAGRYEAVRFLAETGDTLAGDMLVLGGTQLSTFAWLDADNYGLFRTGQSYSALFRQDNSSQVNLNQAVATSDTFYLVFSNAGSGNRTIWARFVLE